MDVIGSKEIAAGVAPAHGREKAAMLAGGLVHEVSILISVGRQLGWQPGAKASMTIMRAPQRGHGQGSTGVGSQRNVLLDAADGACIGGLVARN
jgi:hypothetical protein